MRQRYLTVKANASATLEINKSIFIAHVARTETEPQALEFVGEIRRKYYDATHNCFACIAGSADEFQKADDDGEPSGTAGKPMLEVLKKNRLCDTSLVVTRYFGGIKLGGGGLIRAYGKSASDGIFAAGIVECILHSRIAIDLSYPLLGSVENQLRSRNYTITDKQFTDRIVLSVLEEAGQESRLQKLVTELTSGTAKFFPQGSVYVERDVTASADL